MLRSLYTTLSYQQDKPSLKFGTSDKLGSLILLLPNEGVQLAGRQCLSQGQMAHNLLPKKNGASARQPKLPSIVEKKSTSAMGRICGKRRGVRARLPAMSTHRTLSSRFSHFTLIGVSYDNSVSLALDWPDRLCATGISRLLELKPGSHRLWSYITF
jgi:hypothetical protein